MDVKQTSLVCLWWERKNFTSSESPECVCMAEWAAGVGKPVVRDAYLFQNKNLHGSNYYKYEKLHFQMANCFLFQNVLEECLGKLIFSWCWQRLLLHDLEIICSGFSCNLHSVTRGQCLLQECSGSNLKWLLRECYSGITVIVFISKLKLICIIFTFTVISPQQIPKPQGEKFINIEGYWISAGDKEPTVDETYVLTPSVKLNLKDIVRVVSAGYVCGFFLCQYKVKYYCVT